MRRAWYLLAAACSSSPAQSDGGPDVTTDVSAGVDNVANIIVDQGPAGAQAVNVPYTTITLCRPGTTICQTIDHIEVDTGSVGLRVISSVLDPNLMLPPATLGSSPLIECYRYADGYNWGPVVTADLQIGGEVAAGLTLLVAGGSSTQAPSTCSSAGTEQDTVAALGGNGLIGLGFQAQDCGQGCAAPNPNTGAYYTCSGSTCTPASVPIANQVQNPITLFAQDNNGVAVQLPSIDPNGAPTVTGSLIFGIGTQANNDLGSAQVITINPIDGTFTTTYNGQTLASSFIDSGSLALGFPDSSIPQGSGNLTGFYCPTSPLNLTATNEGRNLVTISTSFNVGNACTLYTSGNAALNDLAITAFAPGYFDWGLPFFYGRTVFTAIKGASTPAGPGPFFAY